MVTAALALGLAAFGLPDGPGALGKVAVLEVQAAEGLEAPWLAVLSEVLTTELAETDRFTSVISSRDVRAMLSFEAQRQIMGCSDEACLAEIGGALGADRIVVSNLAAVGDRFVLTLKLIDLADARTERRAYEAIEGGEAAVLEAAPRLVAQLLGVPAAPGPGPLRAQAAPARAAAVPMVPIALFAVGAAGFGIGVGFGLDAVARRDRALAAEQAGSQNDIAAGQRSALLANVGYGIGATAVLAGALWWWLVEADAEAAPVALGPWLGDGGAGVAVGGRL